MAPTTPPAQLTAVAAAVAAQTTAAPRPLTYDVYANWRSIQGTQLSRDGQWVAYALVAQEADGELVVRHLTDGREWRAPRGTAPVFSADGHYVAFAVQPTRAVLDQAKKDKKKGDDAPKAGAAVMDLSTGTVETVERVKRFAWPKDGGSVLAMLLEAVPAKKDAGKEAEANKADASRDAVGDAEEDASGELDRAAVVSSDADLFADQEANPEAAALAATKKTPGTELVVLDAATNTRQTLRDVADFVWSDDGRRLAYVVSVKESPAAKRKSGEGAGPVASGAAAAAGASAASTETSPTGMPAASAPASASASASTSTSAPTSAAPAPASASTGTVVPLLADIGAAREGVYLLDPARPDHSSAVLRGAGSYRQLKFDAQGEQLAFVSNRDAIAERAATRMSDTKAADKTSDSKPAPTPYKLYLWRSGGPAGLSTDVAAAAAQPLVSADTAGMPTGWSPSEFAALSFSKDGQRLFLGTSETPKAEPADAPEPVKVDLWHWKDPELQSAQKAKAEREKQRSYRAVVHLASSLDQARFVQLARKDLPTVQVNENADFALGLSDLPYRPLRSWDGEFTDAYAVNLRTGEARLVARQQRQVPTLSPAGRYILGFEAAQRRWTAWRTDTGAASVLTARLPARFDNDERDVPDLPEPYGMAGWTDGDRSVVLYDRYDLWQVDPQTLQASNLTQGWGRRQQLQLRLVPLDPEDADKRPLDSGAWTLSGTNDRTRDSGYYRVASSGGQPAVLIQDQKMIGGLIKAKSADRIVFTQQTFREFPDLWTSTLDLRQPVRISQANPQQSQFVWGTQEQIEYTAADGRKLRALLTRPDNFDPSKKYPLMVYIYEKLSDNRYRYVPPAPAQNINVTRYVSNGYIVLRPDIVYTTGHPGRSAMNTVLPAIRQVVAKGYVDPKRIGIQGHSWGAYQINYLITHTTIFRAAEAGASMANMVSGYGGIRWGAGISRAFQYEHGQSRIGATPWERPDLYVENSPIFRVDKVQTPYLTIHNDDDDAVPWYQGIEFFTALRRLGKEAYWFNYNGEKHGLKDRDHMKHFTVHMGEFFDHYLLGSPRPAWMDQPVPYLERGKRDVMGMFKPKDGEPSATVQALTSSGTPSRTAGTAAGAAAASGSGAASETAPTSASQAVRP
ncbi:prolyl oligopeptidase family serine peptidase [Roseateles depolymerans]|uniref:S9 family peptidase n=1 Tax=Roseateles depolymerans TaxID=76731 RepID=UPI00073D6EAD|nr:prolyl oligopeptidase family serine peptidase [Roseateles depolymerans]